MKKKIFIVIGVILVSALAVRIGFLLKGSGADQQQRQRPAVAVETEEVRTGPISEVREFTGSIHPYYRYVVAPKVSGRVMRITKRIGDRVRAGELIAVIDDAEYQQAVYEAEANLRIAEASLAEAQSQFELAKQEKERAESLAAKGIMTYAELEAALTSFTAQQSRLALAGAQIEQRQASLKTSRIRLGYTRLAASAPGYIGERFIDEGALLAQNSAVVSVIGIDSVIVRTTITERDYTYISRGQQAAVSVDAFPEKSFTGKVTRIAPMLQESSRVAQMEVEVLNESLLLKPGMFARVRVVTAEKDGATIVPTRAVVTMNGGAVLFVVSEDGTTAKRLVVRTGIVTPEFTEILSPAVEGRVVTLGQHLLEDGSPVITGRDGPADGGK